MRENDPAARRTADAQELVLSSDPSAFPDFGEGSIFFVGNATVILSYGGFSILTDPNFVHAGDHVHIGYGLTAERLTDPAVEIEDLPPLDLALVSHYHGDHFDQAAERKLDKALPIVTTPDAARKLRTKGFRALWPLKTMEKLTVRKGSAVLGVTALPGRHAPGPVNALMPGVMGSLLEFQRAGYEPSIRIYISGDTLVHEALKEIPRRFPDIDIGLFHLGGTRVLGLLVTMDAAQGIEAAKIIHPRTIIPIHYDDYDRFKSSIEEFKEAVREAGLTDRTVYLKHGEIYRFKVRERASV